ncbi:MAG: hypothetical protein ACOYBS_00325 [Flavobacterium sp.]
MKKIIAIASLFLAFSFNANAQEASKVKSVTTETREAITPASISKNIEDLTKLVTMDESLKKDFTTLLNMRMDALNGAQSEQEKKAIFEAFGKKLLGGLSPEQLNQFKTNQNLYLKLTQY